MAPMLLDLGATCTQADLRQTLGIPRLALFKVRRQESVGQGLQAERLP